MPRYGIAAVTLLLLFLCSCESEGSKQHHLYNLHNCVSQTYEADNTAFQPLGDKKSDDLLGFDKLENRQRNHDYRVADCMSHAEKTTVEYQRAKHDDYGKACEPNQKWSYGSCEPQ